MISIFKPEISQSLMKAMQERFLVKMAIEKTRLSLKTILLDYCLIVPPLATRECWVVIGLDYGPHGDLIEKTLKLAWSYTHVDFDSELYLSVLDQLSAYEAASELLMRDSHNRKISKFPRPRIPAIDSFIEKILKKNSQTPREFIWQSLPESHDDQDLYRDGDFVFCFSLPDKQLSRRGFGIRVEKIRENLST